MSNGINETNNQDFRFRDAAQAIHFKYQMSGMIQSSDGIAAATGLTSVPKIRDREQANVRSQACTIL